VTRVTVGTFDDRTAPAEQSQVIGGRADQTAAPGHECGFVPVPQCSGSSATRASCSRHDGSTWRTTRPFVDTLNPVSSVAEEFQKIVSRNNHRGAATR